VGLACFKLVKFVKLFVAGELILEESHVALVVKDELIITEEVSLLAHNHVEIEGIIDTIEIVVLHDLLKGGGSVGLGHNTPGEER
jgi:hypothetical protein